MSSKCLLLLFLCYLRGLFEQFLTLDQKYHILSYDSSLRLATSMIGLSCAFSHLAAPCWGCLEWLFPPSVNRRRCSFRFSFWDFSCNQFFMSSLINTCPHPGSHLFIHSFNTYLVNFCSIAAWAGEPPSPTFKALLSYFPVMWPLMHFSISLNLIF